MDAFYDTTAFPVAGILESNFETIVEEFQKTQLDHYFDWPEPIYQNQWQTLGIVDGRKPIEPGASLCPKTAELLLNTPGVARGGYSRLGAGSIINPHRGVAAKRLILHLGLAIPKGDLGLKVHDQSKVWENGKCLIFNDGLMHEAWNHTEEDRFIMIVIIDAPSRRR